MKTKKIFIVLISICFSFIIFWEAVSPLFHPGLYPTIDNIVVVRMEDMARELSRGQFPVRYSADLAKERGYMLFNFYAPLPFYAGAFAYKAGINLVGALKRVYLVAFVFAAIGMYLFAKEFFGHIPGMVAAVFFIFSPYFGYDVYWRGGLGEVWAISFLPIVFLLFYKIVQSGSKIIVSLAAFTFAATALSHNLTIYMLFPFLLVWIFCIWIICRKHLLLAIISVILGLGIAAFFWLPAFIEKSNLWVNYLQTDKTTFIRDYVNTDWLHFFFPDFIPMVINWVYIVIPFISILLLILLSKKSLRLSMQTKIIVSVTAVFAFIGIFMSTAFSRIVWDIFYNFLYIFQFVWRFLIIVIFFSSFLAGWIVFVLGGKNTLRLFLISAIFIPAIIWYELPNFRPTTYEFVDKYRAEDPCGTSWGYEYFPTWVSSCIKQIPYIPEAVVGGNAKILSVQKKSRSYVLTTEGDTHRVRIDRYYYPGWTAEIDGKTARIEYDNQYGVIEIVVPKGKHIITLSFNDTPLRFISNSISLTSILIALVLLVPRIRIKKFYVKSK